MEILKGKFTSNLSILLMVVGGVIVFFFFPSHSQDYQNVCLGVAPVLVAHMAAIWGGNLQGEKINKPD